MKVVCLLKEKNVKTMKLGFRKILKQKQKFKKCCQKIYSNIVKKILTR